MTGHKRKVVKSTWIMPTARAAFLDPAQPLPKPPPAPPAPWVPNVELPNIFPAYHEDAPEGPGADPRAA